MFTHRRGTFSKRAVSDDVAKPWAAVGTWFLGPKAENADVFIELMKDAIKAHMDFRQGYVTKFYFTVASYLRLLPWHGFLYQLLFRVCSLRNTTLTLCIMRNLKETRAKSSHKRILMSEECVT